MKHAQTLSTTAAGYSVWNSLWQNVVKPALVDGKRLLVTVSEPTKRRIQEERYHAMIGEIAKQCDYHGRKLGAESWKRLLVEAMVYILREEAKGQGKTDPFPQEATLLPSLDGMRIVQVEVLTRNFSITQASSFIEYLFSFGADRGVNWSDPERKAA